MVSRYDVDDSGGKQTFDHVVAFIDILGSSQILKSENEGVIKDYLRGIDGLYLSSSEHVSNGIKMFSDNILIYSDGSTFDDVQSVVASVAQIQWSVMKEFSLLIRGGVVIGRLDKIPETSTDYIIGRAIVEAHELESKFAIYPRVIVSDDVVEMYSDSESLIKADWDLPFIDYLQMSMEEGFVTDGLDVYRQSLRKHIESNNRITGCTSDGWDRIRSKDVWTLSYYNDFCTANGCEESVLDFKECYDPDSKRIVIRFNDDKGSE